MKCENSDLNTDCFRFCSLLFPTSETAICLYDQFLNRAIKELMAAQLYLIIQCNTFHLSVLGLFTQLPKIYRISLEFYVFDNFAGSALHPSSQPA